MNRGMLALLVGVVAVAGVGLTANAVGGVPELLAGQLNVEQAGAGQPAAERPANPIDDILTSGLRAGWDTDFSKTTVNLSEIMSGGVPRDGIPPIDNPKFVDAAAASEWLKGREPVISLDINGDIRAYPLQIMTWHEIVNDTVGGVPVAVTFCPLCNSAIAFDRRLDGQTFDFGTTGKLRHSDLIMWDRQTQTWWQQLSGEAIVGTHAGTKLSLLPASIVSWEQFRTAYPKAKVLSRDTGYSRGYGRNPYEGYDDASASPFLFRGRVDGKLPAMERVVTVSSGSEDAAYPYTVLAKEPAVNDTIGGKSVVVLWAPGTASALDTGSIPDGRDVGTTGVFERSHEGRTLTFTSTGEGLFRDQETGSRWDVLGRAVGGPLDGGQLSPVVHGDQFWFSWAAFRPDTRVHGSAR